MAFLSETFLKDITTTLNFSIYELSKLKFLLVISIKMICFFFALSLIPHRSNIQVVKFWPDHLLLLLYLSFYQHYPKKIKMKIIFK